MRYTKKSIRCVYINVDRSSIKHNELLLADRERERLSSANAPLQVQQFVYVYCAFIVFEDANNNLLSRKKTI